MTSKRIGRFAVTLFLATASTSITAPHALADSPESPEAQASNLLSLIQRLGQQEEALSEQYDAATLRLLAAQQRVAQANQLLHAAQAAEDHARSVLTQDAVSTYETPGQWVGGSLQNANAAVAKTNYQGALATTEQHDVSGYNLLKRQTVNVRTSHQRDAADAQHSLNALSKSREAGAALLSQLNHAYSQVQGQVATFFAQQQAAQHAADQQAAEQRLAAAQAAQASSSGTSSTTRPQPTTPTAQATGLPQRDSSTPSSSTPAAASGNTGGSGASASVPQGSGVSEAIAAAESRVGDPYMFGAAGPNGFDCSGLVQWAFAQAGISLPHSSGAQYADTAHIPMSALQPGDLVFYADPGQHVAIYIGNGQIVEAPHSGATVQITGLYSEFVLAGRVG